LPDAISLINISLSEIRKKMEELKKWAK
jgi:hypothetical protein